MAADLGHKAGDPGRPERERRYEGGESGSIGNGWKPAAGAWPSPRPGLLGGSRGCIDVPVGAGRTRRGTAGQHGGSREPTRGEHVGREPRQHGGPPFARRNGLNVVQPQPIPEPCLTRLPCTFDRDRKKCSCPAAQRAPLLLQTPSRLLPGSPVTVRAPPAGPPPAGPPGLGRLAWSLRRDRRRRVGSLPGVRLSTGRFPEGRLREGRRSVRPLPEGRLPVGRLIWGWLSTDQFAMARLSTGRRSAGWLLEGPRSVRPLPEGRLPVD